LGRRALSGDIEARNALVMHNQRFLIKTVTEFHSRHNHLEFDDLVSEANIGLMRAAEKFDPETGNRFITYARYWILQALTRFSDQHSLPARLPEHRAEELKKLRKTVQETKSQDIKSLAISSGLDEESVRLLLPFLNGTVSLDAPVSTPSGEEGASLGDLVCPVTVDFIANLQARELLEVIEKLPQRHAEILMHRFGAFGRRRMTLQEIADRYGITRERVRQIESKALAMCRSLGKHIA
ncbi:MAG: sigma-70 family RNA polymerase sigma factor, partial [Spirochaetales bacterium]|nr:sigma-70 family RNA polymerase sigma factor [Spirochaetales bacterium]